MAGMERVRVIFPDNGRRRQQLEQGGKPAGNLHPRALGFVDGRTGFIGNIGTDYYPGVTDTTPLYRTDDAGVTWLPVDLGGKTIAGVCSIDVLKTQRIYQGVLQPHVVIHAAGRVGGPTGLLRSTDGGKSWSVRDAGSVAGMILDVKFLDENTGLIFCLDQPRCGDDRGLILRSTDGGVSWREVYRSGRKAELIWKASFVDGKIGYATVQGLRHVACPASLIVKTTDGGQNWTELPMVVDATARTSSALASSTEAAGGLAHGSRRIRNARWRPLVCTCWHCQGRQQVSHRPGWRDHASLRHRNPSAAPDASLKRGAYCGASGAATEAGSGSAASTGTGALISSGAGVLSVGAVSMDCGGSVSSVVSGSAGRLSTRRRWFFHRGCFKRRWRDCFQCRWRFGLRKRRLVNGPGHRFERWVEGAGGFRDGQDDAERDDGTHDGQGHDRARGGGDQPSAVWKRSHHLSFVCRGRLSVAMRRG